MSIGPMFGLFLHDAGVSFATIFCYAFGSCILGFLCASLVKTPYKPPVKREPISLDRFILMKGMPAGLSLLLLSIPYGMTTNYVAMYARQIGLHTQTGFFFTFMAVGMAISYLFGKAGRSRKNHASNNSRIIPGCLQFLPAFSLCISDSMERYSLYDSVFWHRIVDGSRIWNHVSGI